jgi:phosphoribosyl 1,2-cyclic phosphodiesterase
VRFATLGSGSAGNATIVQQDAEAIMIDCGFSAREIEKRLDVLEVQRQTIRAIVVTHEHGDHIAGAAAFSRKHRIPVYATAGTCRGAGGRLSNAHSIVEFAPDTVLDIGVFSLTPAIVPHDACEPCQFVVAADGRRLGVLTDLGTVTPHLLRHLDSVDALILEFNHDEDLLSSSPYPASLQARIGGRFGHLSNVQAEGMLAQLDLTRLTHLVAAHLSETTNSPELVAPYLRRHAPVRARWRIAPQHTVLPWCEIEHSI